MDSELRADVSVADLLCGINAEFFLPSFEDEGYFLVGDLQSAGKQQIEEFTKSLAMPQSSCLVCLTFNLPDETTHGQQDHNNSKEDPSSTTWTNFTPQQVSRAGYAIMGAIESLSEDSVERLNLSCCGIGDHGAIEVASALKNNTSLTFLDVSSNSIEVNGVRQLSEAVCAHSSLKVLNLSGNEARDAAVDVVASNSLTTLNMQKNWIPPVSFERLATYLKNNTALTHLDLGQNTIAGCNLDNVSSCLSTNTTLTTLGLRCTFYGQTENACRWLVTLLQNNSTLTALNLKENHLSDSAASRLADALTGNHGICRLSLACNSIRDNGATGFAKMLTTNSTLQELDLHGNSIGSSGVIAFADVFKVGCESRLLYLNLEEQMESTDSATEAFRIIKEFTQKNRPTLILFVSWESAGEDELKLTCTKMSGQTFSVHVSIHDTLEATKAVVAQECSAEPLSLCLLTSIGETLCDATGTASLKELFNLN